MANATSTGAICPKTTTVKYADGTEATFKLVAESAAVKRLRRHFAGIGYSLVITRLGSADRHRHGLFFIKDPTGTVIADHVNLSDCLRGYGLLNDEEMVDFGPDRDWRHYVARVREIEINGIKCQYHERISRDYGSIDAATKAAERMQDRDNLAICGFDADRRAEVKRREKRHANS